MLKNGQKTNFFCRFQGLFWRFLDLKTTKTSLFESFLQSKNGVFGYFSGVFGAKSVPTVSLVPYVPWYNTVMNLT
nr:hypothetical protein [Mucilaginibacter sp. E4BP6]